MKTTRNFWPLGILLFFVLFFAGMATAVVIAATHRDSLVSPNYYEQELKYQEQIDGAARAEKSDAKLRFDAANGQIIIMLPVGQLTGKPSGTVALYRASSPELDREFPLELKADGTQTLSVSNLAAGSWIVRVKWSADGDNYFLEQKLGIAKK